jgi:serine/threonine protein phosphatase PrpC
MIHGDLMQPPARETADNLVAAALAAGGRDNVTTVLVDVLEAPVNLEHTIGTPHSGADDE